MMGEIIEMWEELWEPTRDDMAPRNKRQQVTLPPQEVTDKAERRQRMRIGARHSKNLHQYINPREISFLGHCQVTVCRS